MKTLGRDEHVRGDGYRPTVANGTGAIHSHLRYALWDSFWTGPRKNPKPDAQKIVLLRISPILVRGRNERVEETRRTDTSVQQASNRRTNSGRQYFHQPATQSAALMKRIVKSCIPSRHLDSGNLCYRFFEILGTGDNKVSATARHRGCRKRDFFLNTELKNGDINFCAPEHSFV